MSLHAIQKVIGTLEFGRCLKISSIRNPYDRAISAFHANGKLHPVKEISHLKQNGETNKIKDLFLKFLNQVEYDGKMHFCVKDDYQIDHMIRTEPIADDLKKVFNIMQVPDSHADNIIDSIPHKKNANRMDFQLFPSDYFSSDALSIVNDRFNDWFKVGPYKKISSIDNLI